MQSLEDSYRQTLHDAAKAIVTTPPKVKEPVNETELESAKKRYYPIKPKESKIMSSFIEVFDEWAAVAQHLDEVNKVADCRERQLIKQRQEKYRQELEKQTRELCNRNYAAKNALSAEDRELLRQQQSILKGSANEEVAEEQRKKELAAKIMDENVMWKQRAVEAMREVKRREDLEALEVSKKLQEEERAQIEALKRERVKIANALNESYTIQEEMKKREQERAKEMDRKYSEMHREKLSRDEEYRQRVSAAQP